MRIKMGGAWRWRSACGFLSFHIAFFSFLVAATAQVLHAVEVAAFEQANKLYEQGKYRDAAAGYEALLEQKIESSTIYFNLGNAWYKAGQNGRAIAAYLRAERLTPRDPSIRFNLGFVRNKVSETQVSPGTFLQRGLRRFTVNEWSIAATSALWFWFLLLAAREIRPRWAMMLRGYIIMAAAATVVLGAATGAALYDRSVVRPGVVITPEVTVHYGPLDESRAFYTLRDGAEVRVLEEQNSWVKIEDANARQGWVRAGQVIPVFGKTPSRK